jgi:hypothetical protein
MKPQSLCPSINPAAIRLLENADLLSRFNVIWPVQPLQQKYLSSHLPPNQRHNSRRLIPRRGALAIVTNVGMGCGGRGSVERETESQGGFPVSDRVSCRRTALLRTAKPCGPGTRCWCQVGGGFSNPTGGGKTFNPPMTVTRRIRRRGERGISRKTIAQGRRNAPTVPVCSCAHLCASLHTRPRVQQAPGVPCALNWAKNCQRLGRMARRERGGTFGYRHCERSDAIHLAAQRKNGLLRFARNDELFEN